MRFLSRQTTVGALALILAAGAAFADDGERELVFVGSAGVVGHGDAVFVHEGDEGFDLAQLLDGETRTFGTGEHRIVASRRGEIVTLERPDDPAGRLELTCELSTDTCRVLESDDDGRTMVWIQKERRCDGDEDDCQLTLVEALGPGMHGAEANVMVRRVEQSADCEGEDCAAVEVLLQRLGADGTGGTVIEMPGGTFVTEGGAHVVRFQNERTLRCPEGDVTMRVDQDEVDDVFLCPKHSVPLEPVERRRLHRMPLIQLREQPHEH